jgi:hypothetical protein
MNRSRTITLVLFAAALALPAALPLPAQDQTTTTPAIKLKLPKKKLAKFKGTVVAFTTHQIVVKSRENERVVRTFTYTPEVREQMLKVMDRGGYQHGDKVEIQHDFQSDVAVKIKGKPSKPI